MTILARLFGKTIATEVQRRLALAVSAIDDFRDTPITSPAHERDRFPHDRDEVLRDALDTWRVNPLARRIVSLTSQYVVGGGITIASTHKHTDQFLQDFWTHPLNRMPIRTFELCDELTRSGNLFVLISTDSAGMSYVRAIPATAIQDITTTNNDVEQPIAFLPRSTIDNMEPTPYPAYNPATDSPDKTGFKPAMLHFAINRPVGAKFGEPDLAPITRWLNRHAAWLDDRVRLNKYRQAFVWVVTGQWPSAAARLQRQAELNAQPPTPGSILCKDPTEAWEVIHPKLDSFEASEDGLAIKKMIAAGSGTPLHFLAEPESSTRTTAEASGGPAYRHYEQRQLLFTHFLQQIAAAAVRRRSRYDRRIPAEPTITVTGGDISPRDNTQLATAAATIIAACANLRDRQVIDDEELLRLVYKFAGEHVSPEEMLARARAAGPPTQTPPIATSPPPTSADGTIKDQELRP